MPDRRLQPTRSATLAILASATLLLSGCGMLPAPGPATPPAETSTSAPEPSATAGGDQAQQCAQVIAEVTAIGADVARLGELVGTGNLLEALPLLQSVSERVGGLQARVTDPELLERIGEIQTGWEALVADAQESLGSGDAAGIERATTAAGTLYEQLISLQEFCAGAA